MVKKNKEFNERQKIKLLIKREKDCNKRQKIVIDKERKIVKTEGWKGKEMLEN